MTSCCWSGRGKKGGGCALLPEMGDLVYGHYLTRLGGESLGRVWGLQGKRVWVGQTSRVS